MKKIVTWLLMIMLMILPPVSVQAVNKQAKFIVSNVSGSCGDIVDVKICLQNNPGITALQLKLNYSKNDLELIGVEDNRVFGDAITYSPLTTDPFLISWYSHSSQNETACGDLVTLKFKILDNAETSEIKITYDAENVFNTSFSNQFFETVDGVVSVKKEDSTEKPTSKPEQSKVKITSATLLSTSYIYNGIAKKPYITVKAGSKKLIKDLDYKITYKNNIKPGTATVVVTGVGNYTGTITKTFKIHLAKIESLKQNSNYTTNKIAMLWEKVKGADGYVVYRSNSKKGTYKYLKTVTTNTVTLYGLKAGNKYYYKVRAYRVVNGKKVYGAYSDAKMMFTKTAAPKLNVFLKSRTAKISWSRVTGTQGYEIYMSNSKNGTYKKIKTVGSATLSFNKNGLSKGKRYYFRVRSYTKTGSGAKVYSEYSNVKVVVGK